MTSGVRLKDRPLGGTSEQTLAGPRSDHPSHAAQARRMVCALGHCTPNIWHESGASHPPPPRKADLHWLAAGTGPTRETHQSLQWEAHLSGLQRQSKQVVLLPELFLVAPGVPLTRGEAFRQQALFGSVPRGPLGLDPSWISLEVQPAFASLFRTQPLGKGAQSGADSVGACQKANVANKALDLQRAAKETRGSQLGSSFKTRSPWHGALRKASSGPASLFLAPLRRHWLAWSHRAVIASCFRLGVPVHSCFSCAPVLLCTSTVLMFKPTGRRGGMVRRSM
jgi:hypothetical protein